MHFSEVNYLAVLVATLSAFVLGAIWYTVLFGKAWQKEVAMTDEQIKSVSPAKSYSLSFLLMFVMMLGMALMFSHMSDQTFMEGAHHGLLIGFFFVAMSTGINYVYQLRSLKLWFIDSLYQFLFLGIGGGIIAVWN